MIEKILEKILEFINLYNLKTIENQRIKAYLIISN